MPIDQRGQPRIATQHLAAHLRRLESSMHVVRVQHGQGELLSEPKRESKDEGNENPNQVKTLH